MFDRRLSLSQKSAAANRHGNERRSRVERRSGVRRHGERGSYEGDRRRALFSRRSCGAYGH